MQATESLNSKPAPLPRHLARPVAVVDTSVMYKVYDKLATNGARTHELMDKLGNTRQFVFNSNETPVDVPMPFALRLIGNDGFAVLNERGMEMYLDYNEDSEENQGIRLALDQVVATFHELSLDALMNRAKALGKIFRKADGKDAIISFLMENKNTQQQPPEMVDGGDIMLEEEDEFI